MLLPERIDSFWDDVFFDPFMARERRATSHTMKTDISEKDGNYQLDVELPGFKKDDIDISLKDGYLTIKAEKETSDEDKADDGRSIRRERYSGSCSRNFYVGKGLKEDDISAAFNDGILTVTFPKEPEQIKEEPKKIEIR